MAGRSCADRGNRDTVLTSSLKEKHNRKKEISKQTGYEPY